LRWCAITIIVLSTFLSVSSAPLLACATALGIIVWETTTRFLRYRTIVTLSILALTLVVLELASSRSIIEILLPFVSLNQWTAYYRLLIWEHASATIAANALFGIGLNDWVRPAWMPSSVDCFWLVVALTGGIPAIALVAAATVLILFRAQVVHATLIEASERRRARLGWAVAVLSLCVQAFTVHYWGAMQSFFFFVLGLGVWLTDSRAGLLPRLRAVHRSPHRAPFSTAPSIQHSVRGTARDSTLTRIEGGIGDNNDRHA
jgi:hypothetical protein